MARLICPSCNAALQFGVDPSGKAVRCKGCGHRFIAPAVESTPTLPTARDGGSGKKWFLATGGKTHGPYAVDDLRAFVAEGRITANSKVCPVGGTGWTRIGESLPELVETLSPSPPPPDEEEPSPSASRRERPPMGESTGAATWQIHPQRKFAAIAAGVGVVSVFFPWVTTPIGSKLGLDSPDGWIVGGLFAVALTALLAKERDRLPSKAQALWASIPSALAALAAAYDIKSLRERLEDVEAQGNTFSKMAAASVGIGIGLYIAIAAGIAVLAILYILGPKLQGGR